jgi:hypothetical protein
MQFVVEPTASEDAFQLHDPGRTRSATVAGTILPFRRKPIRILADPMVRVCLCDFVRRRGLRSAGSSPNTIGHAICNGRVWAVWLFAAPTPARFLKQIAYLVPE